MSSRRWAREEIGRLDPRIDHERLTHLSAEVRWGDPPLTAALYTVAFCRQMAVPSIAHVVHRGGRSPIARETRRRNDHTMVFFGELLTHGHGSPRGQAVLARMAALHAPYPIRNDQSLYTLASLALEAQRIPALLGVPLLTETELDANFWFWRGVGEGMGLTGIPATRAAFLAWAQAYEQEHYAFTPSGRAVADLMLDDLAGRWRGGRAGRELGKALMDDHLLDTLRLRRPRRAVRAAAAAGLRAYRLARTALPDPPDRSWSDHYGGRARVDLATLGHEAPGAGRAVVRHP